MHSDPPIWSTTASRSAFRGRWVSVVIDTVTLPTGVTYEYTRLEPAGIGVGVVGMNDAGEILLEREYRHGVHEVIWQIPGGLADAGEELQTAGLRELREEHGYAPAAVPEQTGRYLGVVWDNPAMGIGQSHIYLARNLEQVAGFHRDEGEFVTLHWVTPAWLKQAVRSGEIKDRVVVAAVAYLLLAGEIEG